MESILANIGLELRELKETMQTISDTLKDINENMKKRPIRCYQHRTGQHVTR